MANAFIFCDLRTNAVLAELPLEGVSYSHVLNGAGSWSGSLHLGDPRITALEPIAATVPGRTVMYIDRDGTLLYGGIVWGRRWNGDKLELSGSQLWSYFSHRVMEFAHHLYTQVDQLTIARELIEFYNDSGLPLSYGTETSGVLRDREYFGYEAKPVAEAIEQLSEVEGGFDFVIDVAYVSGVPTQTLRLGYPRLGTTLETSGHMFDKPGNIVSYTWPEDSGSQANVVYGLGEGEAQAMLTAVARDVGQVDAGYPILEATISHKDVSALPTLQQHVNSALADKSWPVIVPQFTVRADRDPVLGSYGVGDYARFMIEDPRFPDGLDTTLRIIGISGRMDEPNVDLTLAEV